MFVRVLEGGKLVRIPFKFKNIWAGDRRFRDLVEKAWSFRMHGCAMYQLCKKLKVLKGYLKTLNFSAYSHVDRRVDDARNNLLALQQKVEQDPDNLELRVLEQEKVDSFRCQHSLLLAQMKQQVKGRWL